VIQGTIGFLGFGNMGTAILAGLIETGKTTGKHAWVYDTAPERVQAAISLGANVAQDPAELARTSDTLLLAVKPQMMEEALKPILGAMRDDTLVISIAAGLTIAWLTARLGPGARVVRVMPNTPALVGAGAAGIALGPQCTEADARVTKMIFEGVGAAEVVEESQIDAVTALSGSGPAYFFRMVECLVEAAIAEGLEEAQATRLAVQTLYGAGLLLKESGETAETLRARVTSKGGTTEAALRAMEAEGFPGAVRAAVAAAAARSRELGA
jgi:pyrroline-5-carboxylate reductase